MEELIKNLSEAQSAYDSAICYFIADLQTLEKYE